MMTGMRPLRPIGSERPRKRLAPGGPGLRHAAGALIVFVLLLALVLVLRSAGVTTSIGRFLGQLVDPGAAAPDLGDRHRDPTQDRLLPDVTPEPEGVERQLERARSLPPPQRIDALLALLLQGSRKAEEEIGAWIADGYPRGTLAPAQRQRLEELVRRFSAPRVQRAAAGLLLADAGLSSPPALADLAALPEAERARAAWALGLWAVQGRQPAGTLDWLAEQTDLAQPPAVRQQAWRAMAGLGEEGLERLLQGLAAPGNAGDSPALGEALRDLAASAPATRTRGVPRALELLAADLPEPNRAAALAYLRAATGQAFGPAPAAWQRWWESRKEPAER